MIFLLALLAFGAFAITVAFVQYRSRQARIAAVHTLARSVGFEVAESDASQIEALPFALFSRGNKRAVELVIAGTHNGVAMQIFDYWYRVSNGKNQTYYRFTCALATIPAACPRLRLGHENFLTRLGDELGLDDVQLEYDEFNRAFRVKCGDQKFAFSLLDGEMMQWLLSAGEFEQVEVDGPWVLLVRRRLDPSHWLDLGAWLDGFVHHIPPVVFSTYPPT